VNPEKTGPRNKSLVRNAGESFVRLCLCVSLWGSPALAQFQQNPPESETSGQFTIQQSPGSISGTVVDPRGSAVAGARVELTREGQPTNQEVLSGDDGQFTFANVAFGPFQLTIAAEGFTTGVLHGNLNQGEIYSTSKIALALATKEIDVQVLAPRVEVSEEQIKEQEKQRVLGFIPNFYVSYIPNAAPLTSKQKFELAWKVTLDPVTFITTGAIAGIQQAQDRFGGYGQGIEGYAKTYGASYADLVTYTFIGSAILPSLLKQDPRYFYKGSGSTRSRALYALASSVICKGDNGRWQPNYSSFLGGLAAGGISNLYYPANDRHGASLTLENAAIRIGASAAANLLQEFLLRKLTPKVPNQHPARP
jgi:hypothetical protein